MNRALILFLFFSIGVSFAQRSTKYEVTNLSINTKNNEFGVFLTNDGSVFYLKSNSKNINESGANLYKGDLDSPLEFLNGRKFPTNAVHAVFTTDGNTVYFSEKVGDNFQLFRASVDNTGRWKNSIKLPFNNSNYTYKQPALSRNNRKLFFASNMPGTFGKTDIYYVTISKNGLDYGKPIQLGTNVNTADSELYPFLGKQEKLFFSSDRASSMGGLDIFESLHENEKYAKASNFGTPINSVKDDFAYILIANTNNGYLSSNRIDGFGGADIYYFTDLKPSFNRCTGTINGVVRNKENKKAVFEASVEIFSPQNHMGTVLTNHKGEFSMGNIKCSVRYDVVSYKEGFNGFAEVQIIPEGGKRLVLYLDPEFPEEYEEEFDFSNEMVVYDTQTKEIIPTTIENQKIKNNELSFAERRNLVKLEKEDKKKKIIAAEKIVERKKIERKKEAQLAIVKAQKIIVEKEKRARETHAQKIAETLRKEKELAKKEEKERIEAEIVAHEKAKEEQKQAQELAEQKAKEAKIEAERLTQIKKEQELQIEAERLAKEEEKEQRIEAEKQAEIIAKRETIEKERQARIAQAKETAERLKEEKEAVEIAERKKIDTEIIAQAKAKEELKQAQILAEQKAKEAEIETKRLAQIKKEQELQIETERLAKKEEEEQRIEAEKQKVLLAQKNAIEKERQARITQAKETTERLKIEKELAEQKAEQEILETERIAQIEKEKQLQIETVLVSKEQKENEQLNTERLEVLEAQKEAIEKKRQERISQVKKTSERLKRERELVKRIEKEKQLQKETELLAKEQEEKKRIEAEKQAQLIAQNEAIEKERQERIAQAQETTERLSKERELAKEVEKEEQLLRETELLAKEQEEKKRIEAEKQAQLIAQNEAIEKKRQERIVQAQETAERLSKERELAEKVEKEKQLQKETELLAKEQDEKKRIEAEKQAQLIAQEIAIEKERQERIITQAQETTERLNKERELAESKEKEKIEAEIIAQEKAIAEQKAREMRLETEKLAHEEKLKQQNTERCSRNIKGIVLQSFNKIPISNATIDIYYDGQNLESILTDAKGEFQFYNVDCDTRYTLIGFKKDYNNIAKADINTTESLNQITLLLEPDPEIVVAKQIVLEEPAEKEIAIATKEKEILVEKPIQKVKQIVSPKTPKQDTQIAQVSEEQNQPNTKKPKISTPKIIGKKIQLNPIYFDLDEWYLTLDARRELDKIIVVMAQNKTMIVESGSHTDTRGSFDYNLELSEKRSQETVGYLVANGVDSDRISGRGYGESIPINHCVDGVKCSDREHLTNRRTEFIILKY